MALSRLVADGPRDVPGCDRANLDLSSTIAESRSGPSRNRALLSRLERPRPDGKRGANSIALAAVLVGAIGGADAAHASECGACDQSIAVSRVALACLSQRIDDLVEQARATNPLLINLSECPDGTREDAGTEQQRGELPHIPVAPEGPIEGNDTTRPPSPPSPPANFAILSLRQLECLKQNLNMLASDDDDPTRFAFDVCNGQ